ncbi:FAD-dependent oxidoreductase [Sutterella sp.]|uniref:FAD-dependent oxidoreductase n=1 Tax=Sutterella sp. TaxID=1981025 RepID=UPI0026E0F172|nr:FAD-dependent oxidoreductase [Sutterella sp.]MDO5532152.1 FAD-dependent oxidoreductase [Sutterella sp.]
MTTQSRRSFLTGAAAAGLGLLSGKEALALYDTPFGGAPADDPNLPTMTTDIVVVGAGAAGHAAAVEARKAGSAVIIVEKMGSIGGNSAISQGLMSVPGTPAQKALGIEDSPELFIRDMMAVSYCGHPGHTAMLAREALPTYEWTVSELGVRWRRNRVEQEIEQSVPRAVAVESGSGNGLMIPLHERARALGTEFALNEQVVRLIGDMYDGIKGVLVRNTRTGSMRRILARRGVILAAGGFGADVVFRQFCNPRLSERVGTTTQPGSTSEMLREAARIGAWVIHLHYISCIPDANPDEKGWGISWQFSRYCAGAQGLWVVRQTGERFTNEMGSGVDRTNAVFDVLRAGNEVIAVSDARAVRHPRSSIFSEEQVEALVARGYVMRFPTLEALAAELEIPLERIR